MKSATKIDSRKTLTTLYEITLETGDFISALQAAFIYNTSKVLQGHSATAEEYRKEAVHLSAILAEASSDNKEMKLYVPVGEHILTVWKQLGILHVLIEKKIGEHVLFSDKAVDETIYLLQRLVEILRPAADMILARNTFLSKYIQESQAHIDRLAGDYATLHENRLITGECLPVASSIYVSMLDAIKGIAWHTKEIALLLGK